MFRVCSGRLPPVAPGDEAGAGSESLLFGSVAVRAAAGAVVGSGVQAGAFPHPLPGDKLKGSPPKPSEAGSVGKGGTRKRTQCSAVRKTKLSGLCDDAVGWPVRTTSLKSASSL